VGVVCGGDNELKKFLNNNKNFTILLQQILTLYMQKTLGHEQESVKSEEYSASWDSDIHSGDILFELNEIANFKSDALDQVDDFTGATLRDPITWVEMLSADLRFSFF